MAKSIVTPNCSTLLIAFVIYEISPKKIFVPILYNIAIPMFNNNKIGAI